MATLLERGPRQRRARASRRSVPSGCARSSRTPPASGPSGRRGPASSTSCRSASGWPTTSGRGVARSGSASRSPAIRDTRPRARSCATTAGDIVARNVIVCAGLQSDRLARRPAATGRRPASSRSAATTTRSCPRRGHLVRGLIYPVPDPRFPFLGVHLTRRIDGEVWAGPNAVLAFAREGYRRRDVNLRDLGRRRSLPRVLAPGPPALAHRACRSSGGTTARPRSWPRSSATSRRSTATDIVFGPSGVRGQALSRDGRPGRRLRVRFLALGDPRAQRSLAGRHGIARHR